MPPKIPVVASMVPIPVDALLHEPPASGQERVVVDSTQTDVVPSIVVGCAFTVTG
jgi:hypothetical protein